MYLLRTDFFTAIHDLSYADAICRHYGVHTTFQAYTGYNYSATNRVTEKLNVTISFRSPCISQIFHAVHLNFTSNFSYIFFKLTAKFHFRSM